MNATDFERALAFYTDVLGVRPAATAPPGESGPWAMLVAGWEDSPGSGGYGLRCELFERAVDPPDERRWGRNQNVRPCIQVANLPAVRADLHERGVSFTGELEEATPGQSIEFVAHDGVRWALAHAPDCPAGPDVRTPSIGWVELKAADLDAQRDFYTRVMGLTVGERSGDRVRLEQAGTPRLFLEPGGERVTTGDTDGSPFDVQPVWTSFETPDVTEAAAWLTDRGVALRQDVTDHDWGGRDVVVDDADGNPVQVVEYLDA